MKKGIGRIRIQVISADIPYLMTKMSQAGVMLSQIQYEDRLTIRASVGPNEWKNLRQWLDRYGCRWQIVEDSTLKFLWRKMKQNCILLTGGIILILLTLILPRFVLFTQVSGNREISESVIIDTLKRCGFSAGMPKSQLHTEQLKNAVLDAMPELEWIGIQTSGCVAQITVKEGERIKNIKNDEKNVGNITALIEGVVLSATAERGTVLVSPGDAVQKGQILISGYTDCGIILRAQKPEGEVFAQTIRDIHAVCPGFQTKRLEKTKEVQHFSLRIGKKLIKFYKDSGIYPGSCVKMYSEEYWELPGGYRLPIAWVVERVAYYETAEESVSSDVMHKQLLYCAKKQLQEMMIAGTILDAQADYTILQDVGSLCCRFTCQESIGQYIGEEILRS